jgi:hypothetical protein
MYCISYTVYNVTKDTLSYIGKGLRTGGQAHPHSYHMDTTDESPFIRLHVFSNSISSASNDGALGNQGKAFNVYGTGRLERRISLEFEAQAPSKQTI